MKKLRLTSFWFAFLLLTAVAFSQETNPAAVPENRDCPRFQAEVEWINAIARNETAFPIDILFVGDSITHGWEGAGRDVWKKYYENRRALNFGISGDTTNHVLWRLENAPLQKIAPKTVVVMIGTNNGTKPEETAGGIEKIVRVLEEKYPNAKILLLDVFPRGEKADDPARLRINAINESLANRFDGDENVVRMNLADCFLSVDGTISREIMPDFLHPQGGGYERWAEKIEPELEKTLGPIPTEVPECVGYPRVLDRFEAKNELLKAGNVDVLMIGDSITHYWENEGKDVWKKLFEGIGAVDLGTGWDRTENVIWRLEHYDFSNAKPSKAFLLIGVNNKITSSPENIGAGVRKICEILRKKFPEIKVYVQKVFPWGAEDAAGKNEKRERINAEIEKQVGELDYVTLLDLTDCFLDADGKLDATALRPDKIHLTSAGYERWANFIGPYVRGEKK